MTDMTAFAPAEDTPYWHLAGACQGPVLQVSGAPDTLARVIERLSRLPSLVYLRGALEISVKADGSGDDVLRLGAMGADDAYWHVLARATSLGMISGRGIPMAVRAA